MTTKHLNVTMADLETGDVIHSIQLNADEPTATPRFKSVSGAGGSALTVGDRATLRRTQTRDVIALSGGGEKRFPLGTTYRVERTLTPEEVQEASLRFAAETAQDVLRHITGSTAAVVKARDAFIEAMTTTYADDPAGAIHWQAGNLVSAQGQAAMWAYVGRVLAHLRKQAEADDYDTEIILRAVLVAVREAERELLRGYLNRSTSPYANAVEDDLRVAKAEWLRTYPVLGAKRAAEAIGVTVEDDE